MDTTEIISMVELELARLPSPVTVNTLRAQATQPGLLKTESDPIIFYDYACSSARQAAFLLASYWNRRKYVFGEAAFLPIIAGPPEFVGEALGNGEVALLHSGFMQVNQMDVCKPRKLFLDPSVINGDSIQFRLRAAFVVLQSLLWKTHANRDVILVVILRERFDASDAEMLRWICDTITNTMPLNLRKLHLVYTTRNQLPIHIFSAVDQIVRENLAKEVIFTRGDDSAELFERLESYDIFQSQFPVSMGGSFPWHPKHLFEANITGPYPNALNDTEFTTAVGQSKVQAPSASSQPSASPLLDSSEDNKPGLKEPPNRNMLDCDDEPTSERSRTKNAVYSRRKYLRKKIEFEVLENECNRLQGENAALKREGKRLEELLSSALQCVETHESLSNAMLRPHPTGTEQDNLANQGTMVSGPMNRSTSYHSEPPDNNALLLALAKARLRDRTAALGTITRNPPNLHSFVSPSYPGQASTSLPQWMGHQQRLLNGSLIPFAATAQVARSDWAGHGAPGLGGIPQQRPPTTEDELRRFLQAHFRDSEMNHDLSG